MWMEHDLLAQELKKTSQAPCVHWDHLENATVFVTGATGLIGYSLISVLLYRALETHTNLRVIALVRNVEAATRRFQEFLDRGCQLEFVSGSMEQLPCIQQDVDYIVHCAAPTGSNFFLERPVDTIAAIINGTQGILELAKEKAVKGMVFLSSMEVYGQVMEKKKLTEDCLGSIDILSPRSSYPEAKRLAETLCCSYASQYQVPVCSARLAQTFGPGVNQDDGRVFAYMARCAMNDQDITLKTSGSKENMYLYTMDAVTAILVLLTQGTPGQSYNVANSNTYCSVKEMGRIVLDALGKPHLSVKTNVAPEDVGAFRPDSYLWLDTGKLEALGWRAETNLPEMYQKMVALFINDGKVEGQ